MKGQVKYRQKDEEGIWEEWTPFYKNLFVDDGKEAMLDWLFGLGNWLDDGGTTGTFTTTRYVQAGTSMFNNSSFERASGIEGIPSGSEYDYQIADTLLVSPEDSFLSAQVGSRVLVDAVRRDQVVEFSAHFDSPGDIPTGTQLRELAVYFSSSGPTHDPSFYDASKSDSMLCRSAVYGTGYYNAGGATGLGAGFEPCYTDEPFQVLSDIEFQWTFGELG